MPSDRAPSCGFLAAVLADAIDLEGVSGRSVMVPAADFLFQLIDLVGKKFHRASALGAHHVVMAAPVVLMLVAGDAIVKGDFAGQSAFREQLQRAVDRGIADARIFFLHQPVQFVGRKMVAGFQKRAQNCIALCRLLQAHSLEMLMENSLSFAHHLARDGGLVVDPLLQHDPSG